MLGDAGKDLKLAKERMEALEKERNTAQAQLQTASELLAKAKWGVPALATAVAFAAGAILAYLIRG